MQVRSLCAVPDDFGMILDKKTKYNRRKGENPSVKKTDIWYVVSIAIKGIVHPKRKILSLITHPHVVPNP